MKKAAYAGAKGAYAHQAMMRYFKNDIFPVEKENLAGVFSAVETGECDYGILPVENTITGAVTQNLDLLAATELYICGEILLGIEHQLLGLPGAELDGVCQVFSHEQALTQCSQYLEKHRQWLKIPYFNTAVAARHVAELNDPACAAIASAYARDTYGLITLARDIADLKGNTTRFYVICKEKQENPKANKATVIFTLPHKPSALARALTIFGWHDLNLCRIESRPDRRANWEYRFFADVEGAYDHLQPAFTELAAHCAYFRVLGCYQACTE